MNFFLGKENYCKTLKILIAITALQFSCIASSLGQDILTPKGERKAPTSKYVKKAVPARYSHHKKLSASYSGYMIEIINSDMPLSKSFPLFNHFGNIYYTKTRDGKYVYAIEVDFSTRKRMKNFLNNVVKPKAPEAKLVLFRTGKRKILK